MPDKEISVIFGAGSVGRGFLGQLFSESGYQVYFVDVDQVLVQALQRQRSYTLRLAGSQKTQDLTIEPVQAVDGIQTDQVADLVAEASLVATAVGARALPAIARPIAAGLEKRWQNQQPVPLDIILCENLHDAPEVLGQHVHDSLAAELRATLPERVGFVPAVIARMSPPPTPEQRAADPTLIVAEPYKVLPVDRDAFVGPVPDVVGMYAVSPFVAYTERKLYIHNAGHAMLSYIGYRRGYVYGYEALLDSDIYLLLHQALDESGQALKLEHGLEAVPLAEHVQCLLDRFANRALADTIERIARDPLRKLAADDRLVGAARLAGKYGIEAKGLSWGIAAALAYDSPDDPHAVDLQARLAGQGLDGVMESVCGIRPDEPLAALVRERYQILQTDPAWTK